MRKRISSPMLKGSQDWKKFMSGAINPKRANKAKKQAHTQQELRYNNKSLTS